MKRLVLILMVVPLLVGCNKKTVFSLFEQDRQNYDLTEWIDGEEWVYKDNGKFWVGVTMNDNYDDYYEITILIQNHSDQTILFEPDSIYAKMVTGTQNKDGSYFWNLAVYTNDEIQKSLKRQRNLAVASASLSTVFGSRSEHPQNMMATYALGSMMDKDRKALQVGYLKKETMYPGNGVLGYMYTAKDVNRENGRIMFVDIPVGGDVFSFRWMMLRK